MHGPRSRRDFLRLAAGAAAAATGASCSTGSDKSKSKQGKAKAGSEGGRTLRIVQWSHFVPAYDAWFDHEYTKRWGEEHDVEVIVDHVTLDEVSAQAEAEVAAQRGHDLFGFLSPPPAYEDQVIDHRELVEEVEAKLGPIAPLIERSILNPKSGKYFGFGEYWSPDPANFRVDLWDRVEPGLRPDTWDDVLRAGRQLKAMGHPLGIGLSSNLDSSLSLLSLMHAYGTSIQDEQGNVAISRPATVEVVKLAVAIFKGGMTDEVLNWDPASNNRFLVSGKGSLILNPVSAIRAVEKQDPELAARIALAPLPAGAAGRLGPALPVGIYVVWKFAKNQEAAKRFLVDLAINYQEAFLRSESFNLPAFPGAVKDLNQLLSRDPAAQPAGKYALLADADKWSTNIGHPGHSNAATDEVFNQFIVPKMFAAAARGEMSAEEAVRTAEAQMKPIFDKWRERGKI